MASPADYMKPAPVPDCVKFEQIAVELPCEVVETSVVDQNGRHIVMAPVQTLVKNENAMMLQAATVSGTHQDLEDGQLTYVYESVVPQELYTEPQSPGPSRNR